MKYQNNLSDRFLTFAVRVIKLTRHLPNNYEFIVIRHQLVKSATSVGANYREAQSGSSMADFRSKVNISLKEVSETTYWLQIISLILDSEQNYTDLISLKKESKEIENILGSILQKTK